MVFIIVSKGRVNIYRVPGPGLSTAGRKPFFEKLGAGHFFQNIRVAKRFFSRKKGGLRLFFEKIGERRLFFKISFFKKSISEVEKYAKRFFSRKKGGLRLFFRKNRGAKTFFQDFIFQKKAFLKSKSMLSWVNCLMCVHWRMIHIKNTLIDFHNSI